MTRTLTAMRELASAVAKIVRTIIGAPDYERYVDHHRRCHPGERVPTRFRAGNDPKTGDRRDDVNAGSAPPALATAVREAFSDAAGVGDDRLPEINSSLPRPS